MTDKEFVEYWGEQCAEYEPGCACCAAYREREKIQAFMDDYLRLLPVMTEQFNRIFGESK
jgi:putative ribosome biogenesis GTPase RsgA